MQSISIRNLGPIKEFDYEIKDLTLLIGAQGSGKSTIAKAVYFFQTIGGDIVTEMDGLVKEPRMEFSWDNLSKSIVEKFRKYFEKEYLQNLELVRFQFKQAVSLSLSRLDGGLVVKFSPDFFRLIDEIRLTFLTHTSIVEGDSSTQDKRVRGLAISQAVWNRNSEIEAALGLTRLNAFIPAGRARYSLFEDRFTYLTGTRKNPITDQFINEIEFARGFLDSILKNEDARIAHNVDMAVFNLGKEILGGELRRVNEVDRFFFSDDHSLPVDAISSGQQEALWVVNILLAIYASDTRNFLVIEEPEAHLYPKAQFLLCKLIALVLRLNHAQILITTHSPYIIAAFTNMILADKVGRIKPEQAALILKEHFWIPCSSVFAGEVQDGKVEDIMNRELEMVAIERLDAVSTEINDEFDRLFQLEDIPLDPDLAAYLEENAQ